MLSINWTQWVTKTTEDMKLGGDKYKDWIWGVIGENEDNQNVLYVCMASSNNKKCSIQNCLLVISHTHTSLYKT